MNLLVYFCVPLVVTGQLIVKELAEPAISGSQPQPQYQLFSNDGKSESTGLFFAEVDPEPTEPDTASQNQVASFGASPGDNSDPPFSIYNFIRDKNLKSAQSSPSSNGNRDQNQNDVGSNNNLQDIDNPPLQHDSVQRFPHVTLSPPMILLQDPATGQIFKTHGLQLYQGQVAPQPQLVKLVQTQEPIRQGAPVYKQPTSAYGHPSSDAIALYGPPEGPATTYGPPSSSAVMALYGPPEGSSPPPAPVYGPPASNPAPVYGPPASEPSPVYGAPEGNPAPVYGPPESNPAPVYGAPVGNPAPVYGPPSSNPVYEVPASNLAPSYGPPSNLVKGTVLSSANGQLVQAIGQPLYSYQYPVAQTVLVKALPNHIAQAQLIKSPLAFYYQQPLLKAASPLRVVKGRVLSRPVLLKAPTSILYQSPKQQTTQVLKASGQLYQAPVGIPLYYQQAQAPALISAQPILTKDTVPYAHLKATVPFSKPLLRASPVLLRAPLFKTSGDATIVPAIEQPLPYTPLISEVLPTLSQKAPVYTEKAILKAALTPSVVKVPLSAHYIEKDYAKHSSHSKLLPSQKGLINSLLYSGDGTRTLGGKAAGLLAGATDVELVPSLSYGYSYSMYPKSSAPSRHSHNRHHHHHK